MKRNAVMIADTRPALIGHVLLQIKQTNPGLFDVALIYHLGLSENDKKIMNSIMPCRFKHYTSMLPESILQKERFRVFSSLMFARYEMFHYLTEFDTVTWLDTDVLIQGSLQGLLEKSNKTGLGLVREDPVNKTAGDPDYMRTCFTSGLSEYNTNAYLYCSGTIVLTNKLFLEHNYTDWCYSKTIEWSDILSLPDQGVINALVQHFRLPVTLIRGNEYCCFPSYKRNCDHASIVHSWGANKFWNDWYLYNAFPKWGMVYDEWLSYGGSPLPHTIRPKVSVLIPVYKPNFKHFRNCLESLIGQKQDHGQRFSNFEILILAEPVQQEEISSFVASFQDARIRVDFNKDRLGIAASLNKGLRMANGLYIARMDDDDISNELRLYKQAKFLDAHNGITLCTSDFEYFGDMNERRISFDGEMSRAWSIFTCPFDHPTIMFRKQFFEDNNLYYDETRSHVEDWELWLRAFACGMQVGCIHEVLFYHRWHNGSAGQTDKTVNMMRELVVKNFLQLGITIPVEDVPYIGPWNGKTEEQQYRRLKELFDKALDNNAKMQLYDQQALSKVFSLRLQEAQSGRLSELTFPISVAKDGNIMKKPNLLKCFIKKILKPIYLPFKWRYEDRLIRIEKMVSDNIEHRLIRIENMLSSSLEKNAFIHENADRKLAQIESMISDRNGDTQALRSFGDSAKREMDEMLSRLTVIEHALLRYMSYVPLNHGEKIRILFYFQIPSFWPSWDTFYNACISNSNFDVKFVLLEEEISEHEQTKSARSFLQTMDIPFMTAADFDMYTYNPHVVVLQTPYDEWHRSRPYWAQSLRLQGYRIVYIPYGIEISDTETSRQLQFRTSVIQNAWRIYTFSSSMKRDYLQHSDNGQAARALGHPKFDSFCHPDKLLLPSDFLHRRNSRKVCLWKVHFPLVQDFDGEKKLLTPNLSEYLEFAKKLKEYPELFFVFMPHPKFLEASNWIGQSSYANEIMKILKQTENVYIDTQPDYRPSLVNADYIILDRSAIMVEAITRNVPVLYMHSSMNEPLTKAVQPFVDTYAHGITCSDMVEFVERCIIGGEDKQKKERNRALMQLEFFDGNSGKRIADDIVTSMQNELK